MRKKPKLSHELMDQTAQSRSKQTQKYKNELEKVFAEEAASLGIDEPGSFQNEFSLKDVSIWIDPIDGTKNFLNGDINNVTNLIGITVNQRPKVGILHKPFMNERPSLQRTYVGSVEAGLFFFDHSNRSGKTTSEPTYVPPFQSDKSSDKAHGHFSANMLMSPDFR